MVLVDSPVSLQMAAVLSGVSTLQGFTMPAGAAPDEQQQTQVPSEHTEQPVVLRHSVAGMQAEQATSSHPMSAAFWISSRPWLRS